MGASTSKENEQEIPDSRTQEEGHGGSAEKLNDERLHSNQEDDDIESFVFIDKEWSCSISSAEDAVLMINEEASETSVQPENVAGTQTNNKKNDKPNVTNCEDQTGGCSREIQSIYKQSSKKVESVCRKESNPIDIIPNSRSVSEKFSLDLKSNSEVQSHPCCSDICSPLNVISTGKEEWIQINSRSNDSFSDGNIKLFDIYEIFSNYGSVSALARTKDHIYIKFSSWAGIANVFNEIKYVKQLHQFTSLQKVEDEVVQSHPDRTEIYLDLPSFVVTYLKDHDELARALVITTMTAKDNICLNARKIQQVLEYLRNGISKGFQFCTFYPFGCHVLGSCDRSESLEIFVDTGNMYAGCHKQSNEEQIALCKEVRKLIFRNVTWSSHEESSIGMFYHNTVGLHCILYFNNGFGDRITRLLRVFMDYDERFRVLYLVLDAWSRQCSLQGISNGFNSYIVAVLLVFYLQMLPVPLLPTLQRIRAGRSVVIKGWDCTFIENASMLPRNDCTMDVHSLLRGFFVFYGSYDWSRVVCPALGQSIDRKVFSCPSATAFPGDHTSANYFRAISGKDLNTPKFDISTSMCVQDFFNLSENITKSVSADTLLRFQSLCRQSHKMIYSAECKVPFGPHNFLPSTNLPSVPLQEHNVRRLEQIPKHFNPSTKFGSVSDYTAISRSGERSLHWDPPSEHKHGVYRTSERFSPRANARGNGPPPNWQHRTKKPRSLYNYNEDRRINQLNGAYNSRGRQGDCENSSSRSYKGRVFWHNRARNKKTAG